MCDAACHCEPNRTCAHCLRNAKPWHHTLTDGSAIPVGQPQGVGLLCTACGLTHTHCICKDGPHR